MNFSANQYKCLVQKKSFCSIYKIILLQLPTYLPLSSGFGVHHTKWEKNIVINSSEIKPSDSYKWTVYSKSIETDTGFMKREMNNEWNINFLQNIKCIQKVLRLTLYLRRDKWTMNETLISFKISSAFKKCQNWSCIYQERNEQWMKH